MKLLPLLILSVFFCCYKVDSAEYIHVGEYTYYFSYPDKYSWAKAMEFCRFLGMYLIDITTFFEAIRVSKIIRRVSTRRSYSGATYWTSGTNSGSGQYYWDNVGRTIYWLNWGEGEPSNKSDTCIFIGGSMAISKWRTDDCTHENHFICRRQEVTPLYPGRRRIFPTYPLEDMRHRKARKSKRKHYRKQHKSHKKH